MVDALRRIHQSLRSNAVLLDVHPQPENIAAEVMRGGHVEHVGHVDQDISEIIEARARLARLESEGWFATETRRYFDLLMHFPSVEVWLDYRTQHNESVVPDEVQAKAHRLLAEEDGELITREPIRASLLKPLSRPDSGTLL